MGQCTECIYVYLYSNVLKEAKQKLDIQDDTINYISTEDLVKYMEIADKFLSADSKNVFREHRGGLAESLETTIECPNGLSDIKAHYKDSILRHFIKDMYIQENAIPDDRLPYVWGGKSYNVIARSTEDDYEFVIGQCNFYE